MKELRFLFIICCFHIIIEQQFVFTPLFRFYRHIQFMKLILIESLHTCSSTPRFVKGGNLIKRILRGAYQYKDIYFLKLTFTDIYGYLMSNEIIFKFNLKSRNVDHPAPISSIFLK